MDFDKALIKKDFNRASALYGDNAIMQKQVAGELVGFIGDSGGYGAILDVGCGTGFIAEEGLCATNLIQLDIAYNMCVQAQKYSPVINGDLDNLPLKKSSVDLVTSSLVLQWSRDINITFEEVNKVLRKNGRFAFSILIDGTLDGLQSAISAVKGSGHTSNFLSEKNIITKLKMQNYKIIKSKQSQIITRYNNVLDLMRSIKAIGAANKNSDRSSNITKSDILEISKIYSFIDRGKVAARWNVLYVLAEKQAI